MHLAPREKPRGLFFSINYMEPKLNDYTKLLSLFKGVLVTNMSHFANKSFRFYLMKK